MGKAPITVSNPRIAKLIELEAEGRIKPEHQQELNAYRAQNLAPPKPKGQVNPVSKLSGDIEKFKTIAEAVDAAKLNINGASTGFGGSILGSIPGTSGRALKGYIETLKSNLAFDELQKMRNNSPTGGALGSVSDAEERLLSSTVASLDTGLDSETLSKNLDKIKEHYQNYVRSLGYTDAQLTEANGGQPIAGLTVGTPTSGNGGDGAPTVRPPSSGGDQGGPAPYAGPGPVSDLGASGSTGQNVVGTGFNAVPNPEGQALYKEYLGLWGAKAPDDTIRKWAQKVYAQNPAAMQDVEAALKARSQGKKINFYAADGLLTKNVPSTDGLAGQIADTAGSTAVGAYFANAGNEVIPGLAQNLARRVQGGDPNLTDIRWDTMNAAHPVASTLGRLTGGGLGSFAGEGLATRGLSAIPNLYRGLQGADRAAAIAPWGARLGDTVYGGVSGAASNPDNPVVGALVGSVAGLGGGVLGRQVAKPVSRLYAPVLNSAESAVVNAARRGPGIDAIDTRLSRAADLGVPMGLADSSSELTSLGGAVIRRSPAASETAQNAMIPRSRGQIDRLASAVTRDLGPVDNIPQLNADLSQQARTAAGPLYDAAYAAPGAGAVYPQIAEMLDRPSMQSALGRARRIAMEEGRDPTSLGFDLDAEGNVALTRVPSWQTLDYAKRGLDDVLEGYRDKTSGRLVLDTEGKAINDTRKAFLGVVDAANPAYREARAAYAGPASSRDALSAGQDAFRANPDQLGVDIAGASPERRGQMQLGYRGALMDAANGYRTSTNPFDATLGTPAAEQRLGVLYGDTPGTQRLLETRDLERQMASSTNSMLGNSLTAQRLIADQSFNEGTLGLLADAAGNTAGGGPVSGLLSLARNGIRGAIKLGVGGRAVRRADELAPMLFNTDPASARMTLGDLMRRAQISRDASNNLSFYTSPIGSGGAAYGGGLLSSAMASRGN